ncbi:hypothetical protein [Sulfitobacter profundi]|uniref:30S ribosomal protein S21 n=2 Tax=Sulfitobacter TaxID=60136 RepID=A0ABW1Z2V6_9RHOB
MIDVRLTARGDAEAAKAFLRKVIEKVRLHRRSRFIRIRSRPIGR